jgi:hypothetical protein
MKNVKTIIFSFLLMIAMSAYVHAQQYTTARVSSSGVLTDKNQTKIGTIEFDGCFKDSCGRVIGKMVKNTKDASTFYFIDRSGKKIAIVLIDGTVKDLKGNILYTVSAPDAKRYCKVFDATGTEIGIVYEHHLQKGPMLMYYTKKQII